MVRADINGESVRRAYSVSSSPTRDYLEITIRQTEDPTMSKYLNDRSEGDDLEIKGPYGRFIWKPEISDKLICLGAGSGITPFRAFFEYRAINSRRAILKRIHHEKKATGGAPESSLHHAQIISPYCHLDGHR